MDYRLQTPINRLQINPSEHIRKLVVQIDDYICVAATRRRSSPVIKELSKLSRIQLQKGFELQFVITAATPKQLEAFLNAFRTVHSSLKDARVRVKVRCENFKKLGYVEHLDQFFECSYDSEWTAFVAMHKAVPAPLNNTQPLPPPPDGSAS